MPSFDAQNTDAENNRPVPKSVSRDNDLKRNGRGGLQDIASEEPRDTTNGKRPKTADIKPSKVPGSV